MNNKTVTTLTLAALLFGGALAGCSPVERAARTSTPVEEAPTPEPAEEAPVEEEPAPDLLIAKFGETVEYEDGVTLSVSAPEEFTPSEWAAGTDGDGTPVRMSVTVTNGTSEPIDLAMSDLIVISDEREQAEIYDMDNNLEGFPSAPALPGKSFSWDVGYMVADLDDITVDASPDLFTYEDVYFSVDGQ